MAIVYGFTELVDSDRTYEFSNAENNAIQAELTILFLIMTVRLTLLAGLIQLRRQISQQDTRFKLLPGI